MPDKNVLLILNRAFVDESFRRQLESDLEGTVKAMGLALSDEALAELMAALDEGSDFAAGLDQRLSQSGISLNPGALLRQKVSGAKHEEDQGARHPAGGKTRTYLKGIHISKSPALAVTTAAIPDEQYDRDELDVEVETD